MKMKLDSSEDMTGLPVRVSFCAETEVGSVRSPLVLFMMFRFWFRF
jgi:hypothetical protein